MDKKKLTTTIVLAALLAMTAGCITALLLYNSEANKNEALEKRVKELVIEEKEAAVMQRVNAQMEEIANEERRISDEQREEALEQTRVAEQERRNAEEQTRVAEQERQNALEAEHRALEASRLAQNQRAIAEQQRAEAEHSKRVADTLGMVSVARSLCNTAVTQYMAGNHQIADMLTYTAVLFSNRYRPNFYSPTIYKALAMTSQNKNVWNKHKGNVTDIAFYDNQGMDFVSCSTYGELLRHHYKDGQLQTETLIRDSRYDFRDVYIDRTRNIIYAISRTNQLLVVEGKKLTKVLTVNSPKLKRMEPTEKQMLVFSEQGMALFDMATGSIVKEKALPFKIVTICRYDNEPILFDDKGYQYIVKSYDKIIKEKVPVSGQTTAFAESKNQHVKAYGMGDGTIYFINAQGKAVKLSGQRSRISKIKFDGERLYTASYDGTLCLWLINMEKMEPNTLFTTPGWIVNFTYDPKKISIWAGDQKGNITEACISVPVLVNRLKNNIKRDFTREEWNYYVGRRIPYETIKGKEVKL